MSTELVKFAVVGLGGYGKTHLQLAASIEKQGLCKLDAVVCIDPENHSERIAALKHSGIRVFYSLQELLDAGGFDAITLPVGIHDHVRLSCVCLEAGFNVLVEKPLTGAVQDADQLIRTRDRCGKTIIVGYQNLYSPVVQGIRERIRDGRLGNIISIKLKANWLRGSHYYSRNPWAGTQQRDGIWTLDSPINNALSHYITNILYLCSQSADTLCEINSVQAELFRAWDIENLDTACLRLKINSSTEAIIAMSHTAETDFGPIMDMDCEFGTIHWTTKSCTISYRNNRSENLSNGDLDVRILPWINMINNLNQGEAPVSSLEIARLQTLCINGVHESCPEIINFPQEIIKTVTREDYGEKHYYLSVSGLGDLLNRCVDEGKLFSELGVPWAKHTEPFDMAEYNFFPVKDKQEKEQNI